MKRFPFLDWMRGLAVVLMIQCHTFNSWARMDARESGPYILSQFIGGMAAPLFLFMAGMTLAFYIERPDSNWFGAVRRGAFVLGIAFLFRIATGVPDFDWREVSKVDILNCMGVAMILFTAVQFFEPEWRPHAAAFGALAVAAAAPIVANLDWSGMPVLLRDYVVQSPGSGRFAFFPNAAYVGFGIACGMLVRRAGDAFDRLMQWLVLTGFTLVFASHYFASIPFSLYSKSDFWSNSPALVLIRLGVALMLMCAAYLWTTHGASGRWSWMQCLGRSSLLVYWVHIMIVYGYASVPLHRSTSIRQTAVLTVLLTAAMTGLAFGWQQWRARRSALKLAAS